MIQTEQRKLVGSAGIPRVVESRNGAGRKIVGFAAVYNSLSQDLGGFFEEIEPGTFDKAIRRGGDVLGLVDHETARILGRTSAGTLRLTANMLGLRYEIDAPNTSYANDLVESIRRRDITGSSFAFRVRGDRWEKRTINGKPARVRILTDLELSDVSPVVTPAYLATSVYTSDTIPQRGFDQMAENDRRLRLIQAELEVAGAR